MKKDKNYIEADNDDEIYKENIIDHYKNPHNFGELKSPTHKHKEHNPLCGDNIEVFIKVNKNKIEDVKFIGKGCAISIASMSMLSDMIKGKNIKDIEKLTKDDMMKMLGINVGIGRIKCALLSLKTVSKALEKNQC